jgi:two-component system, NtrC family, sensor kinase
VRALFALFVAACAYAAYRARIRTIQKRQRELEGLVSQRTASLAQANRDLAQVQSRLVHSERMAALGQAAAGVAHELNNPLNFITCNVDTLEERSQQLFELVALLERGAGPAEIAAFKKRIEFDFVVEDHPDLLKALRTGATRVAEIVSSLRSFARADDEALREADLAEGLRIALRMLEPVLREVKVHLEVASLPPVSCRIGSLNQVFMNLIVNAAQAMNGKGELFISGRSDGEFVELRFRDTGPGVPRDLRARIFEPFFTTKAVGKGTGLGLAISFGIVRDHGGTLEVTGEPDEGATFVVRLPIGGPAR